MADSVSFAGIQAGVVALDALRAGGGSGEAAAREPFGDFSALEGAEGRVSVGQTTASADAAHAARGVASYVLKG